MSSHTFARLEDLFHRACPLDAEGRSRLLDQECGADNALRRQVEDLLAAESTRTEPYEHAIHQGLGWITDGEQPQRIGPYRILRELGHGGFSTVYLAQRDDGHFDMQVAIKLVHRHLRSPEVLRRLRRERQILAHLDHPNIARIFDGGSTDDGVPYVVMEYIVGQPLDHYCQNHDLPLRARLELFRQVCDAVQYAHRNLVLHRDLKPSNILVSDAGVVKLLDFGIAKVLQAKDVDITDVDISTADISDADISTADISTVDISEPASVAERDLHTVLTLPGGQALTPEYASPEQVKGRPLTTAADVYSLGVVLYLLICGQRPYFFKERGWNEIERLICEIDPPPPSCRSAVEDTPPAERISGRYRLTELDIIVAKALHKAPERRYVSVEALSEDLRRHLHDLPIEARQDSVLYRGSKFVRRHATAVGFLTVLFVTLLVAVVVTRWQAQEAQRARTLAEQQQMRAERQTVRAEKVASFLEELFEDTDPYANKGRDLTAYEVVERGAQRIRREVRHDPPLSAELMATMGRVYRRMALYDDAEELLQVAIATHRDDPEGSPARQADALRDLGILFNDRGQCEAATTKFLEAAALEQALGDAGRSSLATTLHYQGRSALQCGDLQGAEVLILRSLELGRDLLGEQADTVIDTESLLAELWFVSGEYARAGDAFREVLAKRRLSLGDDHPKVAISLSDSAAVYQSQGDPASAIPLYTEALKIQRQALGERHGSVAQTLYNLGTAHSALGQWNEARDALENSLDTTRKVYGDAHPWIADCYYELAICYRGLNNRQVAEDYYRQEIALRRQLQGQDHPLVARALLSLAAIVAKRQPDEALDLYRQALATQERHADDPLRLAYTLTFLGRLLVSQDQVGEAAIHLRRALELQRSRRPEDLQEVGLSEYYLGQCLVQLDQLDEARRLAHSSAQRLTDLLGDDDKRTRRAAKLLAEIEAQLPSSSSSPVS